MSDSYYDVAQVCRNGHTITSMYASSPDLAKKYCPQCGEETITECPSCNQQIQGYYHVPGFFGVGEKYKPPAFCHNCGQPYPWTKGRLEAAKELAQEAENLDEQEREQLARSLDDIIRDTPRTQVAANRFKRLMAKAGRGTAQAMREIVVDIATEAAKKAIF
jgi:hypothetical protein